MLNINPISTVYPKSAQTITKGTSSLRFGSDSYGLLLEASNPALGIEAGPVSRLLSSIFGHRADNTGARRLDISI
jgi:hypothetical protein